MTIKLDKTLAEKALQLAAIKKTSLSALIEEQLQKLLNNQEEDIFITNNDAVKLFIHDYSEVILNKYK